MSIQPGQLLTILADCSGNQELVGIGNDALDTDFDALGLDSLAVLESVARIERDHGIRISDEEVHGLGTPMALLDRLNQPQTGSGDEDTDSGERLPVVVVGAGPVGLALAGELAVHGIEVTVLERRATPETMVRAGSIGPLAAALLRRRGLADELDRAEQETIERYHAMADNTTGAVGHALPKEHLAGIEKVEHADASLRRMRVEQPALVDILLRHVAALGVDVVWEHEVTGIEQDDRGVWVTAAAPGGERRLRAAYAVGCDGGESTVRRLAGIPLTGTEATLTGRQSVVGFEGEPPLEPGFHHTAGGLLAWGLGVNRVATLEFDGPPAPDAGPLTSQELQDSLRRVTGTTVPIARMAAGGRFTDTAYQAEEYRAGRVLLAGDAAHVHAPFGGQGLNTGITDAANLGWKLAATLNGWAPARLLDTYHEERHPVGARLLANVRAQTALMRPDPHSSALRHLVGRMMDVPAVRQYVGALLSGTDEGYGTDGHGAVGTFLSDYDVTDSQEASPGRGLLLDFTDCATLRDIGARWSDRVDVVSAKSGRDDLAAVLLRPDGYVAWALGTGETPRTRPLVRALRTWFGTGRSPARTPAAPTGDRR
ncbi:FAD-dependent monooxygenase [Streptomyces sp. NPDC006510]|uniref:FAD-dependent monooxygenase n=1 Tax=Streptomyces sp. NPDC006510 TaxID=3155600 RepID=UPI0033AF0391